jgi:protein-tyrosine-phosphatase
MKTTAALLLLSSLFVETFAQKQVVFVCEHGAAKSVIAADYFNRLAAERGLEYRAVCRATAPDSTLNPATRAGFKMDNIPQNLNPTKLTMSDTTNVERIILFTPLPPEYNTTVPVENWSDAQNIDGTYTQRRDAIVKKINALLDSLERK